ncbi:hypothetical protein [Methanofollis sp.]|uniref:hypothetical protein n=1 Tax=Methanofollis sp. TaxID=2052835 RepID=UPI0026292538|nr:hypothetical protein [Methanofollis sp.]
MQEDGLPWSGEARTLRHERMGTGRQIGIFRGTYPETQAYGHPLLLIMAALLLAGGCLQQTSVSPEAHYAEYREAIAQNLDQEIEENPENATAWCEKGMWLTDFDEDGAARAIDPDYALA